MWQSAFIANSQGEKEFVIFNTLQTLGSWQLVTVDLSQYGGTTIYLTFVAHTDGNNPIIMRVDTVVLSVN